MREAVSKKERIWLDLPAFDRLLGAFSQLIIMTEEFTSF
jgi:hypothetical protein